MSIINSDVEKKKVDDNDSISMSETNSEEYVNVREDELNYEEYEEEL